MLKVTLTALLLAGTSWAAASATTAAAARDATGAAERGQPLFQICATCHGDAAAGSRQMNAPMLAGQYPWYLERQFENFRSGLRGIDEEDIYGRQMREQALNLPDQAALRDVVAYIASRDRPESAPATLDGDPERGEALFRPCRACHGPDGEGRPPMNAPRLQGQHDWYLVRQLENFRSGARGKEGDQHGMQMAIMASMLEDGQAVRDVVAYISTLGE